MITKFTRKEFGLAMGARKNVVSNWINRSGKIIVGSDNKIDVSDPLNKAWIEQCEAEGRFDFDPRRIFDLNENKELVVKKTPPPPKKKAVEETPEEPAPLTSEENKKVSLIERKRKAELKKTELTNKNLAKQIDLNDLKIQKQKGALIPFDAAKGLLLFVVESFVSTYIQGVESQLNVLIQRFGGSATEHGELRSELIDVITDLKKEAITNAEEGLDNIADEYAEVRGRGERK